MTIHRGFGALDWIFLHRRWNLWYNVFFDSKNLRLPQICSNKKVFVVVIKSQYCPNVTSTYFSILRNRTTHDMWRICVNRTNKIVIRWSRACSRVLVNVDRFSSRCIASIITRTRLTSLLWLSHWTRFMFWFFFPRYPNPIILFPIEASTFSPNFGIYSAHHHFRRNHLIFFL